MSSFFNPNPKVVVKGQELALDMAHTGVSSLVAANATINVDGKAFTQQDLIKEIEARRKPLVDVRLAEAELKRLRAILKEQREEIDEFITALKTGVRAYLGEKNPEIEKFGFAAPKPRRELTVEEKALRAEKSRLTRAVRHTMGSKQKEAIKGPEVDKVVIENPDAPKAQGGSSTTR